MTGSLLPQMRHDVADRARTLWQLIHPSRDELVDGWLLLILGSQALAGLRSTYFDFYYMPAGVIGIFAGQVIAHVCLRFRWPFVVAVTATAGVYLLFGGLVARHGLPDVTPWPSPRSITALAGAAVHSWMDLLTTAPPIDSDGPLALIPLILGLVAGVLGQTVARRFRLPIAPLVPAGLLIVSCIAIGTVQPVSRLLPDVAFGVVALCWLSLRARRLRSTVHYDLSQPDASYFTEGMPMVVRAIRVGRLISLLALIVVAAITANAVAASIPGAEGHHRAVLREVVDPPLDLRSYPSPLVGFRKYTEDAKVVWDQPLFQVAGLPSGQRIRIATLDDYDGSVWGATNGAPRSDVSPEVSNSFQRVGTRLPTDTGDPLEEVKTTTVTVTIAAAYASLPDINPWLPTSGTPTSLDFKGDDANGHQKSFRYNAVTRSAIVTDRLHATDSYSYSTAAIDNNFQPDAKPYAIPTLGVGVADFTRRVALQWSGNTDTAMRGVQRVAEHMKTTGHFSDGGPGEENFLPGHSIGRLSDFLNLPQLVGDDEQYAAALALIANVLGVPARVVLGAIPAADGTVRGKNIHAWVEVHAATGEWETITEQMFLPEKSAGMDQRPPQPQQAAPAQAVPPPDPSQVSGQHAGSEQALGSRLSQQSPVNERSSTTRTERTRLAWRLTRWSLPPIGVLLCAAAAIVLVKALRRRRRRTRGSASTRISGGWRELMDHLRDLGVEVPASATRREQAAVTARSVTAPVLSGTDTDFALMARSADQAVFGHGEPPQSAAEDYWRQVAELRSQTLNQLARRRRLRSMLSVRSLVRH